MGALIQTKGTRRLAKFFNDRFSPRSISTMRGIGGGKLVSDFGFGGPLLDISDAYLGQWTDGSDVLYPTTTVTTGVSGTAGTKTLTFANALPSAINNGMAIDDDWPTTPSKAIPKKTTVTGIDTTRKIVTISNSLTKNIALGPPFVFIVFSEAEHPNLWKRWRHYLDNDMLAENHSAIQAAIFEALRDDDAKKGFKRVEFQAVEADQQKAVCATEFDLDANGKVDMNSKYKQIVLLTRRTTAKDPLDPQT